MRRVPNRVSRRELLGYVGTAASGIATVSHLGTPGNDRLPAVQNGSNQSSEPTDQVGEPPSSANRGAEPGAGEVDTHVIERGSHRGINDFTYFLDRASLGLDEAQPSEVLTSVYLKFRDDWKQPTPEDTCKIHWAGANLSAGMAGQGGFAPTGDDGWSVRLYTRGPDTGGKVSGGAYVYHLDQTDDYGSLWPWKNKFEIGTWNHIRTHVKLNTVENENAHEDGVVRVWLNGDIQNDRTDVRFRTTEHLGFDRVGPGTYWGGKKGAPQHNVAYYDLFQYTVVTNELVE